MSRPVLSFLYVFFPLSMFCAVIPPVFSGEFTSESRFLEGLLERNLFESAILFCESQRNENMGPKSATESNREKFHFATELLKIYTRQILHTPAAQRMQIHRRIEQLENEVLRENPSRIAFYRFFVQQVISDRTLGDFYCSEKELEPPTRDDSNPYTNFVLPHPLHIRAMEKADRLIGNLTRDISDAKTPAQQRDFVELRDWTEFHSAITHKSIALGFAKDSPERLNALDRALKRLEPLAVLPGDHPVLLQSRLEWITCLRLLSEPEKATLLLNQFLENAENLPPDLFTDAIFEGVRIFLAQNRIESALELCAIHENALKSPEFELLRMEILLAQSEKIDPKTEQKTDHFMEQALELIVRIENLYGVYWGRRAQILLAGAMKSRTSENARIHSQLAEDAYRRNDFPGALRHYDLAVSISEKAGDSTSAFQFAIKAAAIESRLSKERPQEKEHEIHAMNRFREAAIRFPQEPQSPQIFQHAIHHAAHSLQRKEISLSDFIDLQLEYLKTWPESKDYHEFALKTAALLETEGRSEEAFQIAPHFQGKARKRRDAQTLVQQGQKDHALREYKTLLEEYPEDWDIAVEYGELLADSNSSERITEALQYWRNLREKVESAPKKNLEKSPDVPWKCRETIVQLHVKSGNLEHARRMVEQFRLLYPEANTPERKARFERFLQGP